MTCHGGLNCYGVSYLCFTRRYKDDQITLNVYGGKNSDTLILTLEFHPEYGTGRGIEIDMPIPDEKIRVVQP